MFRTSVRISRRIRYNGSTQNDIDLLGPPTKVYWGSIKNTERFLSFGNSSNHLFYSYDNFTELQSNAKEFIGVNNIIVNDINLNGSKEIVIQRGSNNGYYIQVLSVNGRSFRGISNSIIEKNIRKNSYSFDTTNWGLISKIFFPSLE